VNLACGSIEANGRLRETLPPRQNFAGRVAKIAAHEAAPRYN